MRPASIREFWTQRDALNDSPRTSKGRKSEARRYTFAVDYNVPRTSHFYRKKKYVTAPLDAFWHWYRMMPTHERCFYELLYPNVPSKMYFDLDAVINSANKHKIDFVRANMVQDMRAFFMHLLDRREGDCKVLKSCYLGGEKGGRLSDEKYERMKQTLVDRAFVTDASTDGKFSMHVTFPDFVLRNPYHCGAVFRRFECWIVQKYGTDAATNNYYVETDREGGGHEFIPDRAVYTKHRVMRLPWSSKARQNRFLLPVCPDGSKSTRPNFDIFTLSLIQHTVRLPCDPPGGIILHPGGPLLPVVFKCCEARSPQAVVDAAEFPSTAEWIEPESQGCSIRHLRQEKIEALNMLTYSGRHIACSISIIRQGGSSTDETSSSSGGGVNPVANASNASLKSTMSDMLHYFGKSARETTSAAAQKKIEELHVSTFLVARGLAESLGAGKWWKVEEPPRFNPSDPERHIDLIRGTVMVYPVCIKYCEALGAEHQSNHVFFVLDTAYRNGGGCMRQYCYNGCYNPRRAAHMPKSEEDCGNMKLLRAKLQQLMVIEFSRTLSLPSAVTNDKAIFVRHCVTILSISTRHFTSYAERLIQCRSNPDQLKDAKSVARYLGEVCKSFRPKQQQQTGAYTTSDDDDDDDDEEEEEEDGFYRRSSATRAASSYAAASFSDDSVDFYDVRASVKCASYRDVAQQTGVVSSLCTLILMLAIAKSNPKRAPQVMRIYCSYKAWLIKTAFTKVCRRDTVWEGRTDVMLAELKEWDDTFSLDGGAPAPWLDFPAGISDSEAVMRLSAGVHAFYRTVGRRLLDLVGTGHYARTFADGEDECKLFVHHASDALKGFFSYDSRAIRKYCEWAGVFED